MTKTICELKELLDRVEELADRTETFADQIEAERQLPPELVQELAAADIFRLLVPQSLGGRELALPDYLVIVERFARADASTAWCINQAAVAATNAGKVPLELGRKIWGDPQAIVANGPVARQTAKESDGGCLLNGRWNFASGCLHANWIMAFAWVLGEDGRGKEVRQFFVPQSEVEFIDVWQVNGLRGTGSMSFEFTDKFIPTANVGAAFKDKMHETGPLYSIATHLLFACGFAATALGTARAGFDAAVELAGHKKPGLDPKMLRDKQAVQRQIGQADATWRAARAYLNDAVAEYWQVLTSANQKVELEHRVQLRLATTHAIRMAADVVDIAYQICGSSGIFTDHPLQRRYQDVHVISQQIQGRMEHYDTAGQFYLGLTDDLRDL